MAVDNFKSEWYYGFCEISDNAPWWMRLFTRFSPKWCRHVYCFCQAGPFILFVEPSPDKLHLDIKYSDVPLDVVAAKELLEEKGHKIVKSNHRYQYPRIAFIPSCVTIAKTVSGYRSRAITPYGLYKELTMNKPQGPSADEIRARKEQEEALARKESAAAQEASQEQEKRQRVEAAYKRGNLGRRSLIGTSELGVKSSLGSR